jgi:steroid delta-isomerase-like uncharacterized protein
MKKLAAPLVALFIAPACGGDREQTPGPQSPQGTQPSTGETTPMTDTGTTTGPTSMIEPAPAPPRPTLAEMQHDALRTMTDAFNAHDARRIATLYAPDARVAGPGPAGWVEQTGTASVEEGYRRLFAAFPDARWASPRVYMSKDTVIQEWMLSGTHRGDFGSMPATNKTAGVHGATVYWFNDDGRIKRQHTYYDPAAIGGQLGATKAKARAVPVLPAGDPEMIHASGTAEDNRFVDETAAFYKAVDDLDEKAYLVTFAKDAARTLYLMPEDRKGDKATREDFRLLIRAFPDVKINTTSVWGFGDRVLAEAVMTGTHSGAYRDYKATKKPATLHTLDILRFNEDGKIVELTSYGTLTELTPQSAAGTGATPPR